MRQSICNDSTHNRISNFVSCQTRRFQAKTPDWGTFITGKARMTCLAKQAAVRNNVATVASWPSSARQVWHGVMCRLHSRLLESPAALNEFGYSNNKECRWNQHRLRARCAKNARSRECEFAVRETRAMIPNRENETAIRRVRTPAIRTAYASVAITWITNVSPQMINN